MKEIFNPQGKLLCHLDRVAKWLNGENVAPIEVEINPTSVCQHKCGWCYCQQFHRKEFIDFRILKRFLEEFKMLGGRAVNWTGGGEPLMYPNILDAWQVGFDNHLEQGLFTNGGLLSSVVIDYVLRMLRWVRISLDSSTKETHLIVHGTNDFDRIIDNIKNLVRERNNRKLDVVGDDGRLFTLGICMTVNDNNYKEVYELYRMCGDMKIDYLQVRPCLPLDRSAKWINEFNNEISMCFSHYNGCEFLYTRYKFEDMIEANKSYDICYGGQFIPVVDSNADIVNCMFFLRDEKFVLGNLYKESFTEIWNNGWQKRIQANILKDCMICCKNNEINKFLYVCKHKPFVHKNFL